MFHSRHRSFRTAFEPLETRTLMTITWTDQEVYLLELVNRARADPAAEEARLGVNLTQGLTAGQAVNLVAQQPLAFNEQLTVAARLHAQDMWARGYFAHENPDGLDPTARAVNAGYDGQAGENIAAGYVNIDAVHKAWLESLDHRLNVLSLHEDFDDTFRYDEFGAAAYFPSTAGDYTSYYVQEFGVRGASAPSPFLLGVVYDDSNGNNFYTPGEGRAFVNVLAFLDLNAAPVATYTTDAAGNYQMTLAPGTYTVIFEDQFSHLGAVKSVTITNQNVKVDTTGTQMTVPLGDGGTGGGTGGGDTGGGNTGGGNTGGGDTGGGNTGGGNGNGGDTGGGGSSTVRSQARHGAIASPSASPTDLLTVGTIGTDGHAVALVEGDGLWTAADLTALTFTPTPSGEMTTWTDRLTGLTFGAAPSADGLLLFLRQENGVWTGRNLTDAIAGAEAITSDVTVLIETSGSAIIAGLSARGELLIYRQGADNAWTFNNITSEELEVTGDTMPAFTGSLISYVTQWNGLNIAGLDAEGNIRVVWWSPGEAHWQSSNLSALTGAPAFSGGLTAYVTSWGGINLAGIDRNGNVSVTWWVPGEAWTTSDLSSLIDGPSLLGSSLCSYVTSWGGLNIIGLDHGGDMVGYWWAPGQSSWMVTPLSDLVTGARAPVGRLRGVASNTGTISITGVDSGGQVLRFWWKPGSPWQFIDLTLAAA